MVTETTSISLETSQFERPLERLIGKMAAYNTAAIQATAQSQQFAKMLTFTAQTMTAASNVIVQSTKAMTLALEGPSTAWTKRFQEVQNELEKIAPKLRSLKQQSENINILPTNTKQLAKEASDAAQTIEKTLIAAYTKIRTEFAKPIRLAIEKQAKGGEDAIDYTALRQQHSKEIKKLTTTFTDAFKPLTASKFIPDQTKAYLQYELDQLIDVWVKKDVSLKKTLASFRSGLQGGFLPPGEENVYAKQIFSFGKKISDALEKESSDIKKASDVAAEKNRLAVAQRSRWMYESVFAAPTQQMAFAMLPSDVKTQLAEDLRGIQEVAIKGGHDLEQVGKYIAVVMQGAFRPANIPKEFKAITDWGDAYYKALEQVNKDTQKASAAAQKSAEDAQRVKIVLQAAGAARQKIEQNIGFGLTLGNIRALYKPNEMADFEGLITNLAQAFGTQLGSLKTLTEPAKKKAAQEFWQTLQLALNDSTAFARMQIKADPVHRAIDAFATDIHAKQQVAKMQAATDITQAFVIALPRVQTLLGVAPSTMGRLLGASFKQMMSEFDKAGISQTEYEQRILEMVDDQNKAVTSTDDLTRSISNFTKTLISQENVAKRMGKTLTGQAQQDYAKNVAAALPGALGLNLKDLNPQQFQMTNAAIQQFANTMAQQYGTTIGSASTKTTLFKDHLNDLANSFKRAQGGVGTITGSMTDTDKAMIALVANLKRVERAVDDTTKAWYNFSRLVFARALTQVFYWTTQQLREATTAALDLSIAIGEIRTVSHAAPLSIETWGKAVQELSNTYATSQKDIAEALYQTTSNQIASGQQAVDFLDKAGGFARASASTMTESVNLLSSAMNAFKIPISETEVVAAELFKTIELGRVRARDMGDTLGRSAVLAHQAGISLEEYLTMIQTFTISGVRFDQASTFIINVINKLMKPSKELKELFKDWGVNSGQAAIQVYGLQGVVQKMFQATSGDLGELADYIKDIRGTTGFAGMMSSMDLVSANMRKTFGGMKDYIQAQKDVMQSTGIVIRGELLAVKNSFVAQMTSVVDFMASANNTLKEHGGSLSGIFKALLPAVEMTAVLGFFATLGTTFGILGTASSLIAKRLSIVAGAVTLLGTTIHGLMQYFNSLNGVMEKARRAFEPLGTTIKEVSGLLRLDMQEIEKKRVEELGKVQAKEIDIQEQRLENQRSFLRTMMQTNQKAYESQRDTLRAQLEDLKGAVKSAEDWIADFQRKFRRRTLEEQKADKTPMEALQIDLMQASETLNLAFTRMQGASTKTGLENAREDFQAWVDEISKAREILQKEGAFGQVFSLDQYRQDTINNFLATYNQRIQEIQTNTLPALSTTLDDMEVTIKNYNEAVQNAEKAIGDANKAQRDFLETIKETNLEWFKLLSMLPGMPEAFKNVQKEASQLEKTQLAQSTARQAISKSEERARTATYITMANEIDKFLANAILVNKALVEAKQPTDIEGRAKALESFLGVVAAALKAEDLTPKERMSKLAEVQDKIAIQMTDLRKVMQLQAVAGGVFGLKEVTEALRQNTGILAPLQEQQGFLNTGNFEKAIMSEQMRAAQAQSVSDGMKSFTDLGGFFNIKDITGKTAAAPTSTLGPQLTAPFTMHNGGMVPTYMGQGGTVPAYLQAGEFVIDRRTTSKLAKYLQEGDYVQDYERDTPQAYGDYIQKRDINTPLEYGDYDPNIGLSQTNLERVKYTDELLAQQRAWAKQNYGLSLLHLYKAIQGKLTKTWTGSVNLDNQIISTLDASPQFQRIYWNNFGQEQGIHSQDQLDAALSQARDRYSEANSYYIKRMREYNKSGGNSRREMAALLQPQRLEMLDAKKAFNDLQTFAMAYSGVSSTFVDKKVIDRSPDIQKQLTLNALKGLQPEDTDIRVDRNIKMQMLKNKAREVKNTDVTVGLWESMWNFNNKFFPEKTGIKGGLNYMANAPGAFIAAAMATLAAAGGIAGASAAIPGLTGGAMASGLWPILRWLGSSLTTVQALQLAGRGIKSAWGHKGAMAGAVPYVGQAIRFGAGFTLETLLGREIYNRLFGPTEHKATGGFAGFPGGPRGTDVVPAWLTPGEFVVNASAASQHRDLLEQINTYANSPRTNFTYVPDHKAAGGTVGKTNVHYNNNITINNPTGSPVMDASRIARELNRQQYRGTVSLRS